MEKMRKSFQGVMNIIRFNWHFYVFAFILVLLLVIVGNYFQYLEKESAQDGKELSKMSLAEMDEYWNRAKQL